MCAMAEITEKLLGYQVKMLLGMNAVSSFSSLKHVLAKVDKSHFAVLKKSRLKF